MLSKQRIRFEDNGDVYIRNTVNASNAIDETRRMNETGECMGKDGYILGNIPQEMFMFDPWLKAAAKARRERDYGKYTDYMLRFFKVHSALACNIHTVHWNGWNVPLLNEKKVKRPELVDKLIQGAGK